MPETDSFKHYRHEENNPDSLSSNTVGQIFEDSKGNFWIGSTNGGLNLFNPTTGKAVHFRPDFSNPDSIGHNHIWSIHEDETGLLWIGSFGGGLICFDPSTGKFSSSQHDEAVQSSLSSDLVWFVFESRDKVVWIGTDGGGLNKLVKRTMAFNHLFVDPAQPAGLLYNGINAAAEGPDGVLWFANDGGGFQRLDRAKNSSRLFRHQSGNTNSPVSDLSEAILVDHKGIVWIGTYNGLTSYDPVTETFNHFQNTPTNPEPLSDNRIWSLLEDSGGYLWVGTRNGLNRLSPDRNSNIKFLQSTGKETALSNNGIWNIFEDSLKRIWVGTDNGLNRLRPDGLSFDHFFAVPGDKNSLSHNNITVLHEDREGSLWVGTNSGLNYLAAGETNFRQYTIADGLGSNSIRGILEDDSGVLWVTTVKGLTRFNPKNGQFDNFDQSDGLQGSEFSRASCRLRNGEMVIGGRDGINIFDPTTIKRNPYTPPVWLTSIKKQNRVTLWTDRKNIENITLEYSENSISFEFTALDFNNPQHNQYAYMLEGFDKGWTLAGQQRTATYTNLDGGRYLFRVKASNNHGVWNEKGFSVELVVTDPPWKRWWAYLIYLAIATGSVFGLIEYKAYQHRQRLAAVQQTNSELEKEIQERKRVEASLLVSEQRLSMALEASQHGIWEFFPQSGKTYYSAVWFSMLGYEPDEFPHHYQTWVDLLHPEDRPDIEQYIGGVIAEKGESFDIEFRMQAKDGTYRWIQGLGKTFDRDDNGNIVHMSGIHCDITAKKHDEEEARRLESALYHARKMEAIGTLAGGIAHDFNNILAAIIGYSDLLLLECRDDTPIYEKIKQVNIAGLRAKDLVQQILTFSHRNERRLEPLQLPPLINETLKLLRSTLPSSIKLIAEMGEDVPNITADPTQLHQIVMNLCTNSAQAMVEGGEIVIILDDITLTQGDTRLLPHQLPDRYVRLRIKDTGEGIPPDILHNIFTPYFTTKDISKGTGLGLAVVHGIVESYGGSISVDSGTGKGTIFEILIPATIEPTGVRATDSVIQIGSMQHILFVDDEPMLVDVGKKILASLNYLVTATTSSNEALALFRENPALFDMLISDVTMPEMAGDKLVSQIKAIREDLPVILLTGYSDKLQGDTSESLGIEGLMYKPVKRAELAEAIYSIFNARARNNV